MTFDLPTKELSNYLYDLAHENDIPGGHQLEDSDSQKLRNCAERLDAQTVVISVLEPRVEEQAKEIETLNSVSKEMARTGMKIRNDLSQAKLKLIKQSNEIETLRSAISEIRKWDIKTFMNAEKYNLLPIELRKLMTNALNAQNSESVG